ncbi:hypothetical protein DSL72_000736 [Monilinia vaccinii-corymbosi]|uniref:FHA domain-containing protein n=1 Tax=Monilinia vaccinii-corymbosi TaxID=61207 RepID=A0A8A3P062_9HELO|nr:hypothetical protein DSL72_000736 [Monilinia vaccinii-corymbosi]
MYTPQDISNHNKDSSSRKYSRSPSTDSEEAERRRRRRRREGDADRGASTQSDRRDDHSKGTRDRYEDKERHRRRSRSPNDSDSRRHKDHRDFHRRRRDTSRDRRRIKDDENINSAESATKSVASRRKTGPLPSQAASFQSNKDPSSAALVRTGDEAIPEKEKPNLGQTGVLAAASNTITQADGNAIVLKYHEPPEACKPPARDDWKLFVFKGADIIETIDLSTRSCWLIGRELAVVDLAAEHPSISKQHAVIQFKATEKVNEFGDKTRKVKPYLIDLESANGTMLNKDPMDKSRYVELMDKDMIQFGHSTREYVLMLAPRT